MENASESKRRASTEICEPPEKKSHISNKENDIELSGLQTDGNLILLMQSETPGSVEICEPPEKMEDIELSECNTDGNPIATVGNPIVVNESSEVTPEKCEPPEKISHKDEDIELPAFDADGKPIIFNGVEVSKLTKTQLKKYRRMVKWEGRKKEKRAKERLKTKNKKIEAKLNNIDLGPNRNQLKRSKMINSACQIGIIIDLSFDDLMISKDLGKVIKQVSRVYAENRRSQTPMQLHVTNFEGKSKDEMSKHDGYEHWDVNFHEKSYIDIFPKEKLIYLTSESDNVLQELEEDKFYIIGGLVDHNSHKGICYKKAVEQGLRHGQLPIGEYFHMKHRKVFTINQVFEIMLRVTEGKTFKDAFETVLPKRINMQPTKDNSEVKDSGDGKKDPAEKL